MAGRMWPSDSTKAVVSDLRANSSAVIAWELLLVEYWRHTCARRDMEAGVSIADSLRGLREVAEELETGWREWADTVNALPE